MDLHWADLRDANLRDANLSGANLVNADLRRADLRGAQLGTADLGGAYLNEVDLRDANLRDANLSGANLRRADLRRVVLSAANLIETNLIGTDLTRAILNEANFRKANFEAARLGSTVFGNTNLAKAKGLDRCRHNGPSNLDHRTLEHSGPLPLPFLRGCGLPDTLIEHLPSLLTQTISFYSCFISYSSKDQDFASQLYTDLQDQGVRCWFAPEDLKSGDFLHDAIDDAIRLRDKLLLILSETSVASAWVTREVETGLEEETRHGKTVLFPIRLDDAVMDSTDQWAHDIKRDRNIGDFTAWKHHDAYQTAFERLMRDLKVKGGAE